jgi:NAD(P)-dependent dehydrogenase (short-subunit alcohol dehydrogenase family)
MKRLENKVALVMGAGSSGPGWGNGKATAVTYARHGAIVVPVDMNPESVAETVEILRAEGFDTLGYTGDATREADVVRIVRDVIARYGRIDILQGSSE